MTWRELKEQVDAFLAENGEQDTAIFYIDTGMPDGLYITSHL